MQMQMSQITEIAAMKIGAIVCHNKTGKIGQVVSRVEMVETMWAVEFFDGFPEGIFKTSEVTVVSQN